jgi:hypothetical protein
MREVGSAEDGTAFSRGEDAQNDRLALPESWL